MKRASRKEKPKTKMIIETALDHYFNFISATLDVLNHHEQLIGHSIIMNDASTHNSDHIAKLNCKTWI